MKLNDVKIGVKQGIAFAIVLALMCGIDLLKVQEINYL